MNQFTLVGCALVANILLVAERIAPKTPSVNCQSCTLNTQAIPLACTDGSGGTFTEATACTVIINSGGQDWTNFCSVSGTVTFDPGTNGTCCAGGSGVTWADSGSGLSQTSQARFYGSTGAPTSAAWGCISSQSDTVVSPGAYQHTCVGGTSITTLFMNATIWDCASVGQAFWIPSCTGANFGWFLNKSWDCAQ